MNMSCASHNRRWEGLFVLCYEYKPPMQMPASHDTSTPTHWTPLARPFGGLDTQKLQKWHLELGRHDSFWCWGGLKLGS